MIELIQDIFRLLSMLLPMAVVVIIAIQLMFLATVLPSAAIVVGVILLVRSADRRRQARAAGVGQPGLSGIEKVGLWVFGPLLGLVVINAVHDAFFRQSVPAWAGYLLALLVIVLAVVAVVGVVVAGWVIFTRQGRYVLRHLPWVIRPMFVLWCRRKLGRDVAHARRAAGGEGQLVERDGLTIWTDADEATVGELVDVHARVRQVVGEQTGLSIAEITPPRVMCFARGSAMADYSRAFTGRDDTTPMDVVVAGPPRVTVNLEAARVAWQGLPWFAGHGFVEHLLRGLGLSRRIPLWVEMGLANVVAQAACPGLIVPGARPRLLHVLEQRGELWEPDVLVGADRDALSMPDDDTASFYRLVAYQSQSALLTR